MFFVFDLDGTLIDSKRAVRAAYYQAGVEMPKDAFGKPWSNWCTPQQHRAKQDYYYGMLQRYGRGGPLLDGWSKLEPQYKRIITGASERSAKDALTYLGIDHSFLMAHGCDLLRKAYILSALMQMHDRVVYVDADRTQLAALNKICGVAGSDSFQSL